MLIVPKDYESCCGYVWFILCDCLVFSNDYAKFISLIGDECTLFGSIKDLFYNSSSLYFI